MLNVNLGKKFTNKLNGNNDTSMNDLPPAGSLVALVGGSYNGHFATVTSYTPSSACIRIAHGVAQPWARSTLNAHVVVRHRNIRIANASEHSLLTSPPNPCSSPHSASAPPGLPPLSGPKSPPFIQANTKNKIDASVEPDIEFLARLVALRIVKDRKDHPHLRSLFISELDRVLDNDYNDIS
jgi:hypothetical protein